MTGRKLFISAVTAVIPPEVSVLHWNEPIDTSPSRKKSRIRPIVEFLDFVKQANRFVTGYQKSAPKELSKSRILTRLDEATEKYHGWHEKLS